MVVGQNLGLMRLHKETAEIELLLPMYEDTQNKRFKCAARKLKQHWDAGEIPQLTQYACG